MTQSKDTPDRHNIEQKNSLSDVWPQIEKYIDEGFSVIPTRDVTDINGIAKSPYGSSWKKYQSEIISKADLFYQLDTKYNTRAVGLVTGAVSGNFLVIDVDVKYKEGIDALLFAEIKSLFPELFDKLRIIQTPSGGYHIPLRSTGLVGGNQKLAGRLPTESELAAKPKTKSVNFLETRGEGGYIMAYPSLGYSIWKDNPVPQLLPNEVNSLLAICRSFNEIPTPIIIPYIPSKLGNNYYDESPYEDFNNRCEPIEVMEDLGWKLFKHNNFFVWFTRPDKNTGISASFNRANRFFWCFTSSTDLEESKGYKPSNLVATLKFNGDKKKLYSWLVEKGYGKIKSQVETKIVKSAVVNSKPLPSNISLEGKALKNSLTEKLLEKYPYGVFWSCDENEGVKIDRFLFYKVVDGLGFKINNDVLVQINTTCVWQVSEADFFSVIKDYIKEEEEENYREIYNVLDVFIEKHGRFAATQLQKLTDDLILSDTINTSYKCYQNGILKITADKIELLERVPFLIWKHSIQPRDYVYGEDGKYVDFVEKAIGKSDYLHCVTGFLAHGFKDETTAYIIVLTEQCENPKDGGGAGKNVFCELFKLTTTLSNKPGSQVKFDEKFFQNWNGEKLYCISDVNKNFDYSFLKALTDGAGLMKKLYKNESEIASQLMPKFLIQTNYSVEIKDGGLKRRIRTVEFTDFFTKAGGIDVHYNAHFPKGWNSDDWAGFDTTIAKSIQKWFQNGRKLPIEPLSATGWTKQFEQTWGAVITGFIKNNFSNWITEEWVQNDLFKNSLDGYYVENNTPSLFRPSSQKINTALKEYCNHSNIQYLTDISHKKNGINYKCRWFGKQDAAPF